MSTIIASVNLMHSESGLSSNASYQRESIESGFAPGAITVTTTPETLALGDVAVPKEVMLKCISGDDLIIGVSVASAPVVYPFRCGAGEGTLLNLDVAGLKETTTILCPADAGGSLSSAYVDLYGSTGQCRVWCNTGGSCEKSVVTITSLTTIGDKYFDIYDAAAAPHRVWIDGPAGSAPAAPGGGYLVPVIYDPVGVEETVDITIDDDSIINSAYFDLTTPGGTTHRFWFNESGAGVAPSGVGVTLHPIVVSVADDEAACATAAQLVVDAESAFDCSAVSVSTFTVNHNTVGDCASPATSNAAISYSVTTAGVDIDDDDSLAVKVAAAVDALSDFVASAATNVITIYGATVGNRTATDVSGGSSNFSTSNTNGSASSALPVTATRYLEVEIDLFATAADVALAMQTVIAADDAIFGATVVGESATITVTDLFTGSRTDATESGPFTVTTTNQGAAATVVWIKSAGTSSVLVGIAPA